MSKILSLRGTFQQFDTQRQTDIQVFTYEAGDLTKEWEVDSAYIWPSTTSFTSAVTTDHQFQICCSLATDESGSIGFDAICNAGDNRQMGWCQSGYQYRSGNTDFLANSGNDPNPAEFTLDPQHIVKNGLWLNVATYSEVDETVERTWNYMIILKPKKLTASEAILHLIKNVAQDIDN